MHSSDTSISGPSKSRQPRSFVHATSAFQHRLVCLAALVLMSFALVRPAQAAPDLFLCQNGQTIRTGHGQGDAISLRGVNLGSWLVMEAWMSPSDSGGNDTYTIIQSLDSRFGVPTEQSLIKTYQNNWITTSDLDNIKALGMNYIRMPFWWGDVETLNGTWRSDAFAQMDWLVTNAWQRGIYVLIDFHGVVGGQSTSQDTGYQNQNQYWTSSSDQAQTSMIWSNVAAHFAGNPGVLGYDVLNEPTGAPSQAALWSAYNSLYQAIRSADPNHICIMEGAWQGTATDGEAVNWQWDVLPAPSVYGWTNIVYSMHAYPGGTDTPNDEVNKQVADFKSHTSWNVPDLIGEFNWEDNTMSDWQYGATQFDANNINWSDWAYKAGGNNQNPPNSWGIYSSGSRPAPNITSSSTSMTTISNDWLQCGTPNFGLNGFVQESLEAPLPVADSYTNTGGGSLVVNSPGVLANDQDLVYGQSSLTAVLLSNPANGQLSLNSNGSFTYTPNSGFTGTDTFEYQDYDGYVDSAVIGVVTIQVGPGVSVTVESKSDGSGSTVPAQNITEGNSVSAYAIVRSSGTFLSNAVAAWSLQNVSGGVASGDLVAAGNNKSATFTGHLVGSAAIQAVVAGVGTGLSGAQTVTAGAAAQTKVETAANGSGVVVPSQSLGAGSSVSLYAIARDSQGNFVNNAAASWSLQNITGGVAGGDLVAAGDNKSATFTGHLAGSAVVQAVANTFTGQSGVITVNAGPVAELIWTTEPGNAAPGVPFGTQPVLKTADQYGNPSTTGLPATQNVTVSLSAGTGPLTGTTNANIGTSGDDGVVNFSDLEIGSTGMNDQLTATTTALGYGAPVPGMAIWLDASTASTVRVNGSGAVTNWTDLSGNGNNFNTLLNSGGGTPILYTNATTPSGLKTVTFPNYGSGYTELMNSTYRNASTNLSLFIVSKKRVAGTEGSGANMGPMGATDGIDNDYNSAQGFNVSYQGGNNYEQFQHNGHDAVWGTYEPSTAYHDFECIVSGSSATYINGTAGGTGTAGGGNFGVTDISIGGRLNGLAGQNYYDGDIAEVLVYNTALSVANRQTDETYLSNKWMTASAGTALSSAVSNPFNVQAAGSPTNSIVGIANNGNGTLQITFMGTVGLQYYVVGATSLTPPVVWTPMPGSTNTVTNGNGLWFYTPTDTNPQQYYRSVLAN